MEYRKKQCGFSGYLSGTWMEISNEYGVKWSGDVAVTEEGLDEDYLEDRLATFVNEHTVADIEAEWRIKRVGFNKETEKYEQLQLMKRVDSWYIQRYDDNLIFIWEDLADIRHDSEATEWLRDFYDVQTGLPVEVFKSKALGDCTNNGISSRRNELYVMTGEYYPFEPKDIRECICIEEEEIFGKRHVRAKPLYKPRRSYMMGGNFVYTSDSRFKDISGIQYPVPIHDRYEG